MLQADNSTGANTGNHAALPPSPPDRKNTTPRDLTPAGDHRTAPTAQHPDPHGRRAVQGQQVQPLVPVEIAPAHPRPRLVAALDGVVDLHDLAGRPGDLEHEPLADGQQLIVPQVHEDSHCARVGGRGHQSLVRGLGLAGPGLGAHPGMLYQQGSIRDYPENGLGAHVLGFVNAAGDGQYGVEGALEKRLKGQNGLLQAVTDVRNVPLTVGKDNIRIEAKAGENLALTVDRNIQSYTESALKNGVEAARATEGSVIVMNPNNGRVLAMANYPSYNPAEYAKQTNAAVFMNNVTMTPFEPGSIIKSFSFAAAIDKGAVTPSTVYNNTDCIKVADRTMCNALRGLNGPISIRRAPRSGGS